MGSFPRLAELALQENCVAAALDASLVGEEERQVLTSLLCQHCGGRVAPEVDARCHFANFPLSLSFPLSSSSLKKMPGVKSVDRNWVRCVLRISDLQRRRSPLCLAAISSRQEPPLSSWTCLTDFSTRTISHTSAAARHHHSHSDQYYQKFCRQPSARQ